MRYFNCPYCDAPQEEELRKEYSNHSPLSLRTGAPTVETSPCDESVGSNPTEDETPETSKKVICANTSSEDRGYNICKDKVEHLKYFNFFGSIDCDICDKNFKNDGVGLR